MGGAASDRRRRQMAAMTRSLVDWLEAGAVGMAAGLEYQPGALSLWTSSSPFAASSRRPAGVRAPSARLLEPAVRAAPGRAFRSDASQALKVHISHLAVDDTAASLLDDAVASGVDVTFDMYPYTAACTTC